MFDQMKPGHVLRFGVCPKTIISPPGLVGSSNNNTLETRWPAASSLGTVQCVSHPSGNIGSIAADVATHLRTTPASKARSISYSTVGRVFSESNRQIGSQSCDFVGYVDGQTNYIPSTQTVFSKDFSGCLMVVYNFEGQRRVAHAAASRVPNMNCKQAFLNTLKTKKARLIGWFKPFEDARDGAQKVQTFMAIQNYIGGNPDKLVTFGVITQGNQAYSVEAFKPDGVPGNDWVVTDVAPRALSQSWTAT